ncbi:trypco2 family protein [Streptomyces sp. NBC_01465]|uniref:trypco2 family protein n=1 Tax=Streptomyces sp. NBC_01465 TaxID=2903878 RepID=UPI002E30B866|nr:trypco2 family protein [Streptomyces sp. NBC_01465]
MIELSKVIQDLREEISLAVSAGAGEAIQFELGTIVLETHVEMKVDVEAKGKVRFWVVDASVSAGASRTSLHKVTIPLTPTMVNPADPTGARVPTQVADDTVSGEDRPGR